METCAAAKELLDMLERNGWNTELFRRPLPGGGVAASEVAGASWPSTPPVHEAVAREAILAYARIRPYVRLTPLEPSPWLSQLPVGVLGCAGGGTARDDNGVSSGGAGAAAGCASGSQREGRVGGGGSCGAGGSGPPRHCHAFIKLESEQHTGSFKVRGALNKLLSLPPDTLACGVFTASTGNHALAVLYACVALAREPPAPGAAPPGRGDCTTRAAAESADAPLECAAATRAADTLTQRQASAPAPTAAAASTALKCSGRLVRSGASEGERTASGGARGGERVSLPPLQVQLYVPETASPYKIRKLRALGGALHLYGKECLETETAARAAAAAAGAVYVSPYNDLWVMAGQGTLALELLAARRRGELDVVLVPVGGGGLIAGVAAVLKAADPGIKVIGCQPAASDVMARSVAAGAVQPELGDCDTLSDATAGGVEADSLTLGPCCACVDQWVAVEEREIAEALVELLEEHCKLVEGAAACALAAFKRLAPTLAGLSVVVVACGGNVALPTLQRAIAMAGRGS